MKENQLFVTISLAASGLAVWLYIVTQIPTDGKNYTIIGLFFGALMVWLGAIFAGGLYLWRVKSSNKEVVFANIAPSIRQGLILSGTIVTILGLKALNIIGVWEVLLVILAAGLFEIAVASNKNKKHQL